MTKFSPFDPVLPPYEQRMRLAGHLRLEQQSPAWPDVKLGSDVTDAVWDAIDADGVVVVAGNGLNPNEQMMFAAFLAVTGQRPTNVLLCAEWRREQDSVYAPPAGPLIVPLAVPIEHVHTEYELLNLGRPINTIINIGTEDITCKRVITSVSASTDIANTTDA